MGEDRWTADTLSKTSGGFWESCTLHAAVALEIFSVIGDDWVSPEELAEKLSGDLRGVTMLLSGLTAMKLLAQRQGRYANCPESKTLLVKNSPQYMGHIIRHHHHLVKAWSQLPEAVRTGRPVRERPSHDEAMERESFLMGMFNLASRIAPRVPKLVDLAGKQHLLDLGGGPGTYAIHFCLANPQLHATVYDLSNTGPFALKTIEQFGLTGRIDFVGGDYLSEALPGRYDVAWLSHILHGEGPEDCQKIINKTVSVLRTGGLLLVHDFILNDTMDGPLFPALFALNMLVNTPGGQAYSESQIAEMLQAGGVKNVMRLPFKGPNDSGIMRGEV